jgi:hypothetical protein
VQKLIDAIGPARDAMMARLRAGGYRVDHLTNLATLVRELTDIELKLLETIR